MRPLFFCVVFNTHPHSPPDTPGRCDAGVDLCNPPAHLCRFADCDKPRFAESSHLYLTGAMMQPLKKSGLFVCFLLCPVCYHTCSCVTTQSVVPVRPRECVNAKECSCEYK